MSMIAGETWNLPCFKVKNKWTPLEVRLIQAVGLPLYRCRQFIPAIAKSDRKAGKGRNKWK